jgi:SAM-dependent methyltransferase
MQQNSTYYNEKYFSDQKAVSIDNVISIKHYFNKEIKKTDVVLDFGCGGGYLLASLNCEDKLGFDINLNALEEASKLGIKTFDRLEEIENNSLDVIISNSALEHTPTPFEDLQILYRKLKVGGKIIFRVPHETLHWKYAPNDWNYHLFTWSPMALGNLFNEVGFKDIRVTIEIGKRPPFYKALRKIPFLFNIAASLYRYLRIIWEEVGGRRIGVDGYSIIRSNK